MVKVFVVLHKTSQRYHLDLWWLISLHWRHNGHDIASQITSLTIVYSTVYSDAGQRKYQRSASLAFVRGIHRRPVSNAENVSIWWRHHVPVACSNTKYSHQQWVMWYWHQPGHYPVTCNLKCCFSTWKSLPITLTPYMVLPLFATRFADYAGGIRVSFIQTRLF